MKEKCIIDRMRERGIASERERERRRGSEVVRKRKRVRERENVMRV